MITATCLNPANMGRLQDYENNTILMLLADHRPPPLDPYASTSLSPDSTGAFLRMARLYYDRYPWTLDWSNIHGKTALHIAALRGNEELVRVFNFPSLTYLELTYHVRCCATSVQT